MDALIYPLPSSLAYLYGLSAFHRHIRLHAIIFRGSQIYLSGIRFYSALRPESSSKYDVHTLRRSRQSFLNFLHLVLHPVLVLNSGLHTLYHRQVPLFRFLFIPLTQLISAVSGTLVSRIGAWER